MAAHTEGPTGYDYVRTEGCVYPTPVAGTVPLKRFYSDSRTDSFTTATSEGEAAALAVGYRFIAIEGYVFPAK
ncbi:hypothetical protein WDW86_01180 [Bdellovibrionota bacterium FG-2]